MLYLKQTSPGLLPAGAGRVDAMRHARIPVEFKRDILEIVRRENGPEGLLSIGQGIRSVAYDPIWQRALRSENPAVLFDKWRRFEVFAHSKNRVRIDQVDTNRALFERYAMGGVAPTGPENLLICGLMIGLLEAIGCRGLWCDMASGDGARLRIRNKRRFLLPDNPVSLNTGAWTLGWRSHSIPTSAVSTGDNLLEIDLSPIREPALAALVKSVVGLLARDVSRQWKAGELARELGLSARSLQRRLGEAGHSFSLLIRLVRIHEACRLLRVNNTPLTVIGFCSGFSDSAHFSRDFRASVGLTPSEFRRFSKRQEPSV